MRKRFTYKKGQAVIELIASIFTFVMLLVLIASVSIYLYVQNAVVSAVREGARIAALNDDLSGTPAEVAAAIDEIKVEVQDYMLTTTGQTLTDEQVTVTEPDAAEPVGNRSVTVAITYEMDSPFPVFSYLSNIPVEAVATMRYEE